MKYIIIGFILGGILNLFVLFPDSGSEVYPEWTGSIKSLDTIKVSPQNPRNKEDRFYISDESHLFKISANGSLRKKITFKDKLFSYSKNGKFYITFEQVGTSIDFWNFHGDRFWQMKSMEYPYFSASGDLIFLLNGDQSKVRIIDYNGNEIGDRNVSGRLCTVLAFSDKNDFGAIGFLDGTYYLVNKKGIVYYKGQSPRGTIVKSLTVSNNGLFAAIHIGNTKKDYVELVSVGEKAGERTVKPLGYVHTMKTALYVTDIGHVVINDHDDLKYINENGEVEYSIKVENKRVGLSGIEYDDGLYSATYTTNKGESRCIVFQTDGTILFAKSFLTESYMQAYLKNGLMLLRGSDNLYCYRFLGQFAAE